MTLGINHKNCHSLNDLKSNLWLIWFVCSGTWTGFSVAKSVFMHGDNPSQAIPHSSNKGWQVGDSPDDINGLLESLFYCPLLIPCQCAWEQNHSKTHGKQWSHPLKRQFSANVHTIWFPQEQGLLCMCSLQKKQFLETVSGMLERMGSEKLCKSARFGDRNPSRTMAIDEKQEDSPLFTSIWSTISKYIYIYLYLNIYIYNDIYI